MLCRKPPKYLAYLLIIALGLSIFNVPELSFAEEPVASSVQPNHENEETDDTSGEPGLKDTADIEKIITYPADIDLSSVSEKEKNNNNGRGIKITHVVYKTKDGGESLNTLPAVTNEAALSLPVPKDKRTETNEPEEKPDLQECLPINNETPSCYNLITEDLIQKDNSVGDITYKDFPVTNTSGLYKAAFSLQSGEKLLKFTIGDTDLLLSPVDSDTVAAKTYKNIITYENINPHIDLQYILESYRLKENIIIKNYTKKNEFQFQIHINNAAYQINTDGTIAFKDSITGKHLFSMAKPFALDNKGDRCDLVDLEIDERGILKVVVDPEWLRNAAYPVMIDPTLDLTDFEVYQQQFDFSSTQGLNNWYYEEQRADSNYYQMTWDSLNTCWKGTIDQVQIGCGFQYPGTNNAVLTWRAPHTGTVLVWGGFAPDVIASDSVKVKIVKNTTQLWPSSGWHDLMYKSAPYYFYIAVNEGDHIRFIVNKKETNAYDRTISNPIITYYDNYGTGILPFWNYTNNNLGGGWDASVNTATLNIVLGKTLFAIPGRGLPIGETVTYNSLDTRDGPLGPGWHLGSDTSITPIAGIEVEYIAGDGSNLIFKGSTGSNPPPGIYLTIEKESQGNFKITDKNKNKYQYNIHGKPEQFIDRNGNTTTFTYDNDRLTQLSDPSGRCITYSYNPDGKISTITDPGNHAYHFTYQNGLLSSITDPDNKTITLTYNANSKLSTFSNELNQITTFNYSSNGKVQSIRDARTLSEYQ